MGTHELNAGGTDNAIDQDPHPDRLRVVPLSLSPSCVTWTKTARKNGRVKSWGREARERSVLLAPRISRGHFLLTIFFRVMHDGISERGTTRSLHPEDSRNAPSSRFMLQKRYKLRSDEPLGLTRRLG